MNLGLLAATTDLGSQLIGTNSPVSKGSPEHVNTFTIEIVGAIIVGIIIFMIKWCASLFKTKPTLESFDQTLTRECLIQSARILVVDDEEPLLIGELKSEGFAVDHDREGKDLHNIESQIYDLTILDYHGVGRRLGSAQGLDLLKHIRRVSPRTRLIAYTSRSLNATESEFFRLSHIVLPKDMGLGDSLTLIEAELRKAFSKEHLLEALMTKLSISSGTEKEKLKDALVKALSHNNETAFKEQIIKIAGSVSEKAVEIIISKMFLNK
jgi:DNA-binding response OmpR family regulator